MRGETCAGEDPVDGLEEGPRADEVGAEQGEGGGEAFYDGAGVIGCGGVAGRGGRGFWGRLLFRPLDRALSY